ncbi:LLM class flavin-dependent oxidoreductase [Streptomyces sp. SID14478]|uniref:LLM class flavin-dependent oxidoreductase n=1 Tax=Streptomyces sp. SID14478 TaxID=2706073 RepID=UPI0013D8FEFF|nr:LLM class flavin-dependent oxidoreductase [Streptomyces sp. SID14478]NEB74764.1 LLM class flavin-dependent oxidoreductase [Streptomyces sp. SID14478]
MSPVPLSVLDLVPLTSGSDAATALHRTVRLARSAEEFGYRRYWLAEHHLNPGVAGSSPALVIQAVAQATSRIRVGSGAVLLGHRTPLSVVEEFGILDAFFPGRIDLGLGRSGRPRVGAPPGGPVQAAPEPGEGTFTDEGLYVPPRFTGLAKLLHSPRFQRQLELLQQPGARTPPYADQLAELLDLLAGTSPGARAVPGTDADVEVWVLGSSGGESAELAGARGLPFAANYHVSPGTVLDAVEAYRAAFKPSRGRDEPYVVVSADVVVGEDDAAARELAAGYAPWVRSIRGGEGAIPYPTPEEARRHPWTDEDRELVRDRVDTQFVGAPATVAEQLTVLQRATGADELLVTTITHDHGDRVRSYELLAREWGLI